MALTTIDKNRIVAATVLTMVMLPIISLTSAGGDSGDGAGQTTVVATTTTLVDSGIGLDGTADAPVNLEGPTGALAEGEGQIAYPADRTGTIYRGTANYRRFPQSANTGCSTSLAPLGITVKVYNLDNGRSIECFNVNIGYSSPNEQIILNISVFEKIADLVDAPIPVEISW